jgi:F-type H+-transporting ATPase subunit delta
VTAKVTSAKRLSQSQMGALSESLRSGIGKNVKVDVVVDESLIGGLIVRVGSRMVDTSIRSKLASLQNVMKEVG